MEGGGRLCEGTRGKRGWSTNMFKDIIPIINSGDIVICHKHIASKVVVMKILYNLYPSYLHWMNALFFSLPLERPFDLVLETVSTVYRKKAVCDDALPIWPITLSTCLMCLQGQLWLLLQCRSTLSRVTVFESFFALSTVASFSRPKSQNLTLVKL